MANAAVHADTARAAESRIRRVLTPIFLVAAVAIAVLVVHWPALSARAISFDDREYVLENPLVLNPSWASLGHFFGEVSKPSTVRGYYHPLSMTSLMLDVAMGGSPNDFVPFHRTSLALHLINTALIFVLLYQLFGNGAVAAIVALLFGAHPMTVEPVPWLGERKTLLAAFFALSSLCLYVRYARTGSRGAFVASLVAFLLALLSKPTSIPLAAALLILDYWPLRRLSWRTVLEKIPFLALCAVFAVITFLSQRNAAAVYLPSDYPATRIPLTVCHNIVFYLEKMIWPKNLSSYYALPNSFDLSNPALLAGVIGTPILLVALAISLRRTRAFAAGWVFFFVMILPAMGIIGFTGVIASDKYAYLPVVGLLLTLAWLLGRTWVKGRVAQLAIVAVALGLVTAEASATRRYYVIFQDSETLFRHMLKFEPTASPLLNELGRAAYDNGKTDEGIRCWEAAIRYWPTNPAAHFNLGVEMERLGKIDAAIAHYKVAARAEPDNLQAHFNIGLIEARRKNIDAAVGEFREVLRINPDDAEAQRLLAAVEAERSHSK
ncbi:MAG: tetratricopeptide repeat protein [Planctomycetes bacterium]|nr:tetratricopeptide repeat protein [Planctomycetota bacterium]MBI3843818.1 tetratricopeptide repeat protein [Planctomycetota bacterium]